MSRFVITTIRKYLRDNHSEKQIVRKLLGGEWLHYIVESKRYGNLHLWLDFFVCNVNLSDTRIVLIEKECWS